MHRERTRVFAVGLDGGTLRFIRPLAESGRLPNFARLMEKGAWGELESTIPPATPPAWSSFMTGKNPGKHGVFNFYFQPRGSYGSVLVSGSFVRAKKFWDYLQEAGKSVGLIDIPLTFPPPDKMRGFMISGVPVPAEEAVFTCPPELHTEIIREFGDYPLEERVVGSFRRGNHLAALKLLYHHQRMRKEVAAYLLGKYDWDFFMVVFRGTDLIQHSGFRFYDEDFCRRYPQEARKYREVIPQVYERIDSYLGELLQRVPSDCVVMIMSDHGAGPVSKTFYINRWLREQGFLSLKTGDRWRNRHRKLVKRDLGGLLSRAGLGAWNRMIPSPLRQAPVFLPRSEAKELFERVNWARTVAYSSWILDERIVRVNLQGREPEGIVPEREYDRVREEIAQRLCTVRDPETHEPIVERIYRREELYQGPFLDRAGDLVVMTKDNSYMFRGDLCPPGLFDDLPTRGPAVHRLQGVFLLKGAGIKQGREISGARIIDLAPTLLHLYGLPVPEDMDGRVLKSAFDADFLAAHPVTATTGAGGEEEGGEASRIYSVEEEKRIEETLRGLGYIG